MHLLFHTCGKLQVGLMTSLLPRCAKRYLSTENSTEIQVLKYKFIKPNITPFPPRLAQQNISVNYLLKVVLYLD